MFLLAKNSWTQIDMLQGRLLWCSTQVFFMFLVKMLVYRLVLRSKCVMNGPLTIKKAIYHAFYLRFVQSGFLWPWWRWNVPFLAMTFCFRVVIENPRFVVMFDVPKKGGNFQSTPKSLQKLSSYCPFHPEKGFW